MKVYAGIFAAALGLLFILAGGTGSVDRLWTSLFGFGTSKKAGVAPVSGSLIGGGLAGSTPASAAKLPTAGSGTHTGPWNPIAVYGTPS